MGDAFTTTLKASREILNPDRPLLGPAGSNPDPDARDEDSVVWVVMPRGGMTSYYEGDRTAHIQAPSFTNWNDGFHLTMGTRQGAPEYELRTTDMLSAMEQAESEAGLRGWVPLDPESLDGVRESLFQHGFSNFLDDLQHGR